MQATEVFHHDKAAHAAVIAHIEHIVPLLVANFGAIPIAYTTYPQGLGKKATYHLWLEDIPSTIGSVAVAETGGTHTYVTLSAHNVTWLLRGKFATELYSWSPTAADPLRAAYGRIILSPNGPRSRVRIAEAAHAVRAELQKDGLDAVPLLDGGTGIVLWIPLADGPTYPKLATWLSGVATRCVAAAPDLFTVKNLIAQRGDRVSIGTRTNHPGCISVLPYVARGSVHLPVALPVAWSDLDTVKNGSVLAADFPAWFAQHGDVFATASRQIAGQRLPATEADPSLIAEMTASTLLAQAHGVVLGAGGGVPDPVIAAVLQILADGKARSADDILAEGLRAGLLPTGETRKHLYTDLYEYIRRTLGTGKEPQIVEDDTTKCFRLNRPADTWPDVNLPSTADWLDEATVQATIANLHATSVGEDPTAFEIAVCDAFGLLGFTATHCGGNNAPDGTLDAQLGVLGYRVVLECKTAKVGNVVANPRPEEAASFLEAYHGDVAVLIGPAFHDEATLHAELIAHATALWTVDDLAAMLQARVGPHELRAAFAPGVANAACTAILWERAHGRPKRLAVLRDRLLRAAWRTQASLAGKIARTQMPVLTRDALFLFVDQQLQDEGVSGGAALDEFHAACEQLCANGDLIEAPGVPGAIVAVHPPVRV